MAAANPKIFDLGDPPAALFSCLATHGYCIVNAPTDTVADAADVLSEWFTQPLPVKHAAATAEVSAGAAVGRGFFILPEKEVLEVKQGWRPAGVHSSARLAASSAFKELGSVASTLLQLLFSNGTGSDALKATTQQVQAWLGQTAAAPAASSTSTAQSSNTSSIGSSSSVLHVSSYKPSSVTPAPLLGGSEEHVDRGLLTVIADTAPGLQVFGRDGSWVPITPSRHQLVVLVGHTLSWATAGRLPAALHRVVLPDSAGSAAAAPRLSLAFKLQADPHAVFDPASIAAAADVQLEERYRAPKRTHELMAAFDASHQSIHNSSSRDQQQKQQRQQHQQQPKSKRPCTGSAAAAQRQKHSINFLIRNQRGEDVNVSAKLDSTIEAIYSKYAHFTQLPAISFRLVFNGRRPSPADTVGSLGIEDGDIVDAFLEQNGD